MSGESVNTPDQFAAEVVHRWMCRVSNHESGTKSSRHVLRQIIELAVRCRDSDITKTLPTPTPKEPGHE